MALLTKEELALEDKARDIANDQPMGFHADSCPYLISGRRVSCRCNCFSFALRRLREEAGLPPE